MGWIVCNMIESIVIAIISAILGGFVTFYLKSLTWQSNLESELNAQYSDYSTTITTHKGKEVVINIESITISPLPETIRKLPFLGYRQSMLPEEYFNVTRSDKRKSMQNNEWIVTIQYAVEDGDAEELLPSFINPNYSSHMFDWIQADKLHLDETDVWRDFDLEDPHQYEDTVIKTRGIFHSSVGEFGTEIQRDMNKLQNIQYNMLDVAMTTALNIKQGYLIDEVEAHDKSVRELEKTGFDAKDARSKWNESEQVKELTEFIFGPTVTPDEAWEVIDKFKKNRYEEGERQKEKN